MVGTGSLHMLASLLFIFAASSCFLARSELRFLPTCHPPDFSTQPAAYSYNAMIRTSIFVAAALVQAAAAATPCCSFDSWAAQHGKSYASAGSAAAASAAYAANWCGGGCCCRRCC